MARSTTRELFEVVEPKRGTIYGIALSYPKVELPLKSFRKWSIKQALQHDILKAEEILSYAMVGQN